MTAPKAIQLGEFCARLKVADREVRYVLESGLVPRGVKKSPARGNHRQFDPAQAFWLALVVKLRRAGINTALAATAADCASMELKGATHNLGWDWTFWPDQGQFDTDHQYLLEVADAKYGRLLTDANPSKKELLPLPWCPLDRLGKKAGFRAVPEDFRPVVVLRIDLTRIARVLAGSRWTDGL